MDLLQRVERLEKQNRYLRTLGLFAGVFIGGVLLIGAARLNGGTGEPRKEDDKVADVIEAQKFILRDRDGKQRAALQIKGEANNYVAFELFDARGNRSVGLYAGPKGSGDVLLNEDDPESKEHYVITLNGSARYLHIYGKDGKDLHIGPGKGK